MIVFNFGICNNFLGKNWLNVVVMIKLGVNLMIFFIFGELEIFFGCNIWILCFRVVFFIGVGVIICFCLIGWLGCVIIVWIL